MFRFTRISHNRKTGPIPTSMTAKVSCPSTCPFKGNGCYAEGGPTNMWWDKCDMPKDDFLNNVRSLPSGQFWRHNVAGDLIHVNGLIHGHFLSKLISANRGKKGFTYTHHLPSLGRNKEHIQHANANGFTVNLSANTLDQAVEYSEIGPTVVAVKSTTTKNFKYKGKQFVVCPATYRDKITCANCQLCQKANRNCIVAFPAHGVSKRKMDKVLD